MSHVIFRDKFYLLGKSEKVNVSELVLILEPYTYLLHYSIINTNNTFIKSVCHAQSCTDDNLFFLL